MTPHAARIKAEREKRADAVQERLDAKLKRDNEEAKRAAQEKQRRAPTPEEMAHAIADAFKTKESGAHELAAQLLKNAPDELRARVYELAGMNSQFKQRRSRKPNGY